MESHNDDEGVDQRGQPRPETPQLVSRDTVIRALDGLYEQTGDRRFDRIRAPRRQRRGMIGHPVSG